ncbi:MAG TPA: dipeptide epimerase [Acidimicrobiales bacterium]|nr:dipeptide epimerase [Acidimicrobiales bacterium]
MKLVAASVYALDIPFVESFSHSVHARRACDSVIVRVVDEDGVAGFGEGAPRPYVTGETPASMVEHLAVELWPAVAGTEVPSPLDAGAAAVDAAIPETAVPGVIAPNAARCALELAMLDCALRSRGASAAALLPPQRPTLTYSGVITAGDADTAARRAHQMRLVGLEQVKVKVGTGHDVERVRAVREALGPDASLRVDANGAWDLHQALQILDALAPFAVDAVEQPLPRHALADLKALRRATSVPVMADESLVTLEDAKVLLAEQAVDVFNIRVSKCGGLHRSAELARMALAAGVGVQVGSQVGETAILSAAGRHLAAWAPEVAFVEGSYGTLLLAEDVSVNPVRFGHRGRAGALGGPGLGVDVVEEKLRRYARRVVELSPRTRP